MRRTRVCWAGLWLLAAGAGVLAAPTPGGPDTGVVKDRVGFIPARKFDPLDGKAVGVLVADVRAFMAHDGRGGPADAMGFSVGGNSYRWVYVPVSDSPLITNLNVPVKGGKSKLYPGLGMANPTTVKRWGVAGPFALVEVQVNDGLGSPAGESFVATRMKRLDGTREYPLKVPEVVVDLRKRYQGSLKERQKKVDESLAEVGKKVLKGRKVTGPRETKELLYVTWLPGPERLRVNFRTTVSDGSYEYVEGGAGRGPFPLPPPPKPGAGKGPALAFRPPLKVRIGVTFGVELGMSYEVNKGGKLVAARELPIKTFHRELAPPPGVRPGRLKGEEVTR